MVLWAVESTEKRRVEYLDFSCTGPNVHMTTHHELASGVLRVSVRLWV